MSETTSKAQQNPFGVARSAEDWARELDCSPAAAQRALDHLIAIGFIEEVKADV